MKRARDPWDSIPHRNVSRAEAETAAGEESLSNPIFVAGRFLTALVDRDRETLDRLVTPEALASWGDYSVARRKLAAIKDWGIGSIPEPSSEHPNVVYVKVLGHVKTSFQFQNDEVVMASAVVSLVRRGDLDGGWYVLGMGEYWY